MPCSQPQPSRLPFSYPAYFIPTSHASVRPAPAFPWRTPPDRAAPPPAHVLLRGPPPPGQSQEDDVHGPPPRRLEVLPGHRLGGRLVEADPRPGGVEQVRRQERPAGVLRVVGGRET